VNYSKIFNDLFIANLLLNFEDRLGFGKVTAKNQVAPFSGHGVYMMRCLDRHASCCKTI